MSRSTWAIVIGVLGLVVVSIALAFVLRGREPTPDLETPTGVTLAFVQAIERDDAERAWELLAGSARGQTTRERFLGRATQARSLYERARLSVENERIEGDTARVELVRTYSGSGGPFAPARSGSDRSTVRLVREDGQWRIATPPDPFMFLLER